MDIHDLQMVLEERADSGRIMNPDLDALVDKGRALRTRRQLATGLAAAVVVAAAVTIPWLVSGGPGFGSGPATIHPAKSPTLATAPSAISPTPAWSSTAPSPTTATRSTVGSVPPSPAPPAPTRTAGSTVDTSRLAYGDCVTPTVEPSEIVLTCADHGLVFGHLHWTSWTSTRATAVGTETYKSCNPNCATGGVRTISTATVTLSKPVPDSSGRLIWSELQFAPQPPGYATGPYQGGPYPLPVTPG